MQLSKNDKRAQSLIEITARFINGIGTGILNAIVPVWATETAEHTSRGQFIAIEFTLNIFGVVLAYWLELYVLPPPQQSSKSFHPIARKCLTYLSR